MEGAGWREKLNQFRIPIALSVLGLVLIVGGIFASGLNKAQPKKYPKESLVETPKVISVDVSGAVNKPAVYQLKEGSRIQDAVTAAGGFTEDANEEYISKYLNMAQTVSDGTKVYVPSKGEGTGGSQTSVVAGVQVQAQAKVNINTSGQSGLEALSGIGPVTASKILSGRPYSKVEDLLNKKIISKSVFEKIKDQIVVY